MEFAGFPEFCHFESVDGCTIGEEFLEGFGCDGGRAESVAAWEESDVPDGSIPIFMEHGCVTATTPGGGDHLFDHFEFHFAGGLEAIDVVVEDGIEAFLIFGQDEGGLRIGAVFEAIESVALFAFYGDWAARFAAVDTRGFELFLSSEPRPALFCGWRLGDF